MQRHKGRIAAIQMLRALAAGTVCILHVAFAYADHIGPGLGLSQRGSHLAQVAVVLFFVVSGYIMVISSRKVSGSRGGARVFLTRRCIRIFLPYWIATGLLVTISFVLGPLIDLDRLAWSLALVRAY